MHLHSWMLVGFNLFVIMGWTMELCGSLYLWDWIDVEWRDANTRHQIGVDRWHRNIVFIFIHLHANYGSQNIKCLLGTQQFQWIIVNSRTIFISSLHCFHFSWFSSPICISYHVDSTFLTFVLVCVKTDLPS